MKFEKIKGLIVAPFTPFDKNGEVDLNPIAAYAAMLKEFHPIGPAAGKVEQSRRLHARRIGAVVDAEQ